MIYKQGWNKYYLKQLLILMFKNDMMDYGSNVDCGIIFIFFLNSVKFNLSVLL